MPPPDTFRLRFACDHLIPTEEWDLPYKNVFVYFYFCFENVKMRTLTTSMILGKKYFYRHCNCFSSGLFRCYYYPSLGKCWKICDECRLKRCLGYVHINSTPCVLYINNTTWHKLLFMKNFLIDPSVLWVFGKHWSVRNS